MSAVQKKVPKGGGLLPEALRESATKISYGLAALGVALGVAGFFVDRLRFGFAYLTGFVFTATIVVGALFFVVIQHLTKAGWSVAPRRIMEWISQGTAALVVLFIPLIPMAKDVWSHWMGEHAAHDVLVQKKVAYLNVPFFYTRTFVYLVAWALLAFWVYRLSREQDRTGDRKLSERLQGASAPATALLGLTISFAGFDWVMSLDPHWYSTIFGVYVFAGALITSTAVLSLVIVRYRRDNIGGDLLTVEHQHDVGKFLLGFTVFWAYIGFSQFMLIFYANIPEETIFFKHRWEHGWSTVSLLLLFGHFILPFCILLSRTAKRVSGLLSLGASLIIVMHYVDVYWMVMPTYVQPGQTASHFAPSWIDLAGLLAPVGLTMAWIANRVLKDPAYPLKDPYIPEALKAENL